MSDRIKTGQPDPAWCYVNYEEDPTGETVPPRYRLCTLERGHPGGHGKRSDRGTRG